LAEFATLISDLPLYQELDRTVPKSSWSPGHQRPDAEAHYNSLSVSLRLGDPPEEIVLVDDVITKGSTLLAGASRLAEAFPDANVGAFALVRTQNAGNSGKGMQIFGLFSTRSSHR
jgi:adenine/guanine phosphoribosyltransferase-like PRPP-binding protein